MNLNKSTWELLLVYWSQITRLFCFVFFAGGERVYLFVDHIRSRAVCCFTRHPEKICAALQAAWRLVCSNNARHSLHFSQIEVGSHSYHRRSSPESTGSRSGSDCATAAFTPAQTNRTCVQSSFGRPERRRCKKTNKPSDNRSLWALKNQESISCR